MHGVVLYHMMVSCAC